MQPFLSPPKTMLWMTNKTAFSLQKKYPSFGGFFLYLPSVVPGDWAAFFQLSLVPCLCTSKLLRRQDSSWSTAPLRHPPPPSLMGIWERYAKAHSLNSKMRALCLLLCVWCMWKQTCFHSPGIRVHKHFLQSAPGMCEQQPGPCGTGTPVVK